MKSMTLATATALAGALYLVSPAAKADILNGSFLIVFGNQNPASCGPVSGSGSVCGIDMPFGSIVVHGFTGAPGPAAGDANLTLKPTALNGLAETCTDPYCEILPPQSVSVIHHTARVA